MADKITRLSLKVNFSWTLISNIMLAFSQWITLIIIAKLGTPAEVGSYSLGLAFTAPLFLLSSLQLRAMQVTDVKGNYKFSHFFALRVFTSIIAMFLLIGLLSLTNYTNEIKIVIILVGVTKFIDSFSDITHGLMQKNERMDYVSKSKLMKSVLSILSFSLTLLIFNNLKYALIAMSLSWLAVFLLIDLRKASLFESVKLEFERIKLIEITRISLPLGIATMLISLNTNIPRYILEHFNGVAELGLFTTIAYIVVSGTTVMNSLGQSAAPRLSRYYTENNLIAFKNLLRKLIIIGFVFGILGLVVSVLLGKQILTVIYTPLYGEYNYLLITIMISGIFMYTSTFLGFSITATKNFRVQPVLGLIWILVSLLSALVLIPQYGMLGGALTLIVTSLTQLISQAVFLIVFFKK